MAFVKPTTGLYRAAVAEVDRLVVEVGKLEGELIEVDVELGEERAKRKAVELEVGRLEGELKEERRRREDQKDAFLEVVRAMQASTEEGRKGWAEWQAKAKWRWNKDDGSSRSSSSSHNYKG